MMISGELFETMKRLVKLKTFEIKKQKYSPRLPVAILISGKCKTLSAGKNKKKKN